jgi:Class III cytochrome C family
MFSKKELKLAYGAAVCLLLIGVISYAAFPLKAPEEPLRLMYTVMAGNVLFNHKIHASTEGYGLSCFDCHHHPPDDESALMACGDCHSQQAEDETVNQTCLDCHDESEIEDTEMLNRLDAFHTQCIDCHKDFEAGPAECAGCHAL